MNPTIRRGVTLTEIMIATVIIVLVSIPVLGVFSASKQTITRTDERREKRHFLNEILARAQRHSLQTLWEAFGPYFVGGANCGYMRDRIAEVDGNNRLLPRTGTNDPNPLGFTQDFVDDLFFQGYEARVRFEFYPRAALGVLPPQFDAGKKDTAGPAGMLHMQSGYLMVGIRPKDDPEDATVWRVPLMCPAIVGRPGLKLEGCPALDEDVRRRYGGRLQIREGQLGNEPPLF